MFTTSVGVFVFGLLATIAGGAVGAAIGGNYAFVLTGFCVLASWGVFAGYSTKDETGQQSGQQHRQGDWVGVLAEPRNV